MKRGVPPTARNARTGEFTPPGIRSWARMNRVSELVIIDGVRKRASVSGFGRAVSSCAACEGGGVRLRRGADVARTEHPVDGRDEGGAPGGHGGWVRGRDAADRADGHAQLARGAQ